MPIPLSSYGRLSSEPAPVNRMMASFAEDFRPDTDINLGVGYVNEGTIPRELIREALDEVLARPDTYKAPFNYGGARGSANLVDAIRRFLADNRIGGLTADALADREIIIGANGATSLLEGIADVIEPGVVITSDPMYYIYCNFLERKGFQVRAVPEDADGIDTCRVRRMIDSGMIDPGTVRFIYVVTVNNPTGTILANRRRRELTAIAGELSRKSGRLVPVIFDRAYEDLIHDPSVPTVESALPLDRLGVVFEVGTLSKVLAPALRIGYLIGADSPFLRAMVQKTSDAGFSAPLFAQEIAAWMLDNGHVRGQMARVNDGYRGKARAVGSAIRDELDGFLESVTGGRAGFYFHLTFREIETTEDSAFFRFLARATGDPSVDGPADDPLPRVIYVPGAFCVHPRGEMVETGRRQLRISYGFEETGRILAALSHMRKAAEYALEWA